MIKHPVFETYLKNQKYQAQKRTFALAAVFVLAILAVGQFAAALSVLACRPEPVLGSLTVTKIVNNDNGGTASVSDFTLRVDKTKVISGQSKDFEPGTYQISECGGPTGYVAAFSGDCSSDGNITIEAGKSYACTISNDDQPGVLYVKKVVINDNGGTKQAQDFSFTVNDGAPITFEADGQNDLAADAGTYDVSETAPSGYAVSYHKCRNIKIKNGGEETCTITNDDVAVAPTPQADLGVSKTVDDETVDAGQTVTYTIVVTNFGPDSAASAELNDLLPSNLTFVSANPTKGTYDQVSGVWTIGDLLKDEVQTLQILATAQGEPAMSIVNSAEVNLAIDPIISNNTASATITINTPAPSPSPSPAPTPSESPSPTPLPSVSPTPTPTPSESPSPSPSPTTNPVLTSGGGSSVALGNGPVLQSDAYTNWLAQQKPVQIPAGPVAIVSAPQGQVKGVTTLPSTGFDLTEALALATILLTAGAALFAAKRKLTLSYLN